MDGCTIFIASFVYQYVVIHKAFLSFLCPPTSPILKWNPLFPLEAFVLTPTGTRDHEAHCRLVIMNHHYCNKPYRLFVVSIDNQ